MRAALIGRSEPVHHRVFPIEKEEITVGRSPESDVYVQHRSVSRVHCVIRVSKEGFELSDRESHNGTFVNGLPVRKRMLVDGDRLTIGEAIFSFRVLKDGEEFRPEPDSETSYSRTVAAPNVPLARETSTLLRVREMALSVQELYLERSREVEVRASRQLFNAIRDMVPSRRGALLLIESEGQATMLAEFRSDPQSGAVTVPEGLVAELARLGAATSGLDGGTSWLAAPLMISGRAIGCLYVDSAGERRDYVANDRLVIAAISDILALAIENARDMEMLRVENGRLQSESGSATNIIGESASITALQYGIHKVAPGSSTVLIRGESGTGKELVARSIHRGSARSARPFVAINCAAVAETLLESEFFGHERGAFTGAVSQRKGRLEMADGGTVFLDEIGEMSLPLQAKLLRVVQEREFERVGGSRPVRVDIRLIAATNRDLEKSMREGSFREDLFYRLNVVTLRVPALRERREDIPLLAGWFVRKFSEETGRRVDGISREARAMLVAYDWPGNVRELQNVIERAVVMGSAGVIIPEDLSEILPDLTAAAPAGPEGFHESVREHRKRLILAALEKANGNVAEAARGLQLHPVYLHRLITNLGLR